MAVTDAWSIGPTQMPWFCTHAYSPPERSTPRSMTRLPEALTSLLPDTCSFGAVLAEDAAGALSWFVLAGVTPPGVVVAADDPHASPLSRRAATPAVAAKSRGGRGARICRSASRPVVRPHLCRILAVLRNL